MKYLSLVCFAVPAGLVHAADLKPRGGEFWFMAEARKCDPANLTAPITMTVGAYQNGRYGAPLVKPSTSVYRTFSLLP